MPNPSYTYLSPESASLANSISIGPPLGNRNSRSCKRGHIVVCQIWSPTCFVYGLHPCCMVHGLLIACKVAVTCPSSVHMGWELAFIWSKVPPGLQLWLGWFGFILWWSAGTSHKGVTSLCGVSEFIIFSCFIFLFWKGEDPLFFKLCNTYVVECAL